MDLMRTFFTCIMALCATLLLTMGRSGASTSELPSVPKAFTNSLGIKMLPIKPGTFMMGEANPTPESLKGPSFTEQGDWDERPAHRVTISKPFFISETPVTIEQYRQFKKEYHGTDLFAPYVAGISWADAMEFCRWLSKKEGKEYRLPTEAEWEYAARAGTTRLFWSGNAPPKDAAPNPWGLKDIADGVPEWCYDWHAMYPDEDLVDPVGPASGITRVVRDGGIEMREPESKDDKPAHLGFKGSKYKAIDSYYRRSANRASMLPDVPSPQNTGPVTHDTHFIGFRIVQAPLPSTTPWPVEKPFTLDCVRQSDAGVEQGPDMSKPYFKARPMLPIPPENDQDRGIGAVGLHPGILPHIHSGGIAVLPNGDLLQISFSSSSRSTEYDPNTTMVVTRLRHGAEQFDMPDLFYDIADINDQSVLLWNDNGKIWFFGGGRYFGDVRFKYATSTDSGATWSNLTLPLITEQKAFVEAQPITSAFRGPDGAIYFGADGEGGSSMLWASRDNGKTWYDTGGRTAGRHTTFVMLRDGRLLGTGGKSTDIEGYMPKVYSSDGGKTWSKPTKTPFPALGSNQRPVILRLKSGRLFFAGDFQQIRDIKGKNKPPEEIKERGSFVALSDDEGETWRIKKLEMSLPHESRRVKERAGLRSPADNDYGTLGYAAAAQGPNGVIYLMTSMNHPSMLFALNEAWMLSDEKGEVNQKVEGSNSKLQTHEERYGDGKPKATWGSRTGANGDYVLHGTETWYYPDGKKKYEVTFQDGIKVGKEIFWLPNGAVKWSWDYRSDGTGVWTHYWPNGRKKIESTWRDFKAEGVAVHWDQQGNVIKRVTFKDGAGVH